ncbi:hypothetical protein B0J13DRAFT_674788 [Dactylonectria estremocensis]|uniref:Uncharacterized protein n=1 Tax=Dactylonectria estremocensis TaxID=1079267 RepID=A0A9P9F1Z4_9HYPO|nr:hypothetical protein B0J13DRAFT_674788 [Dactylonectria estremocensis]
MAPNCILIPRKDGSQHHPAVIDAAISELLRVGKQVPVEYVDELRRRMDWLMMDMDNQFTEAKEEKTSFKDIFDAPEKKSSKGNTGLLAEVQSLREALDMKTEEEEGSSEAEVKKSHSELASENRKLQVKNESLREMNVFIGSKIQNKELEMDELKDKVKHLEVWQSKWQTKYEEAECRLQKERQDKKIMRKEMKALDDEVKRLTRGIHGVLAKLADRVPCASGSVQEPRLPEALINCSDGENPPCVLEWLSLKDIVGEDQTLETFDMLKDELESVYAKLGLIREERDILKTAHQALYTELKTTRSSWSLFIKAIAEASDTEHALSKDTRLLIKKMYEDLADLERKFLMMWPGAQASVRQGQLNRDMLTKAALDKAQLSLQHELEQAVQLQHDIIQQEQEYAMRLGRMDIIAMNKDALEEAAGIADYRFSRCHMCKNQTPPGMEWTPSEHSEPQISENDGMENGSGQGQLPAKIGELGSDADGDESSSQWQWQHTNLLAKIPYTGPNDEGFW